MAYWHALYDLRRAVSTPDCDDTAEVMARRRFVFGLLAELAPNSREEAVAVLRYLIAEGHMDGTEAEAILLTLIGSSTI